MKKLKWYEVIIQVYEDRFLESDDVIYKIQANSKTEAKEKVRKRLLKAKMSLLEVHEDYWD